MFGSKLEQAALQQAHFVRVKRAFRAFFVSEMK
jgi:hypothetical protein